MKKSLNSPTSLVFEGRIGYQHQKLMISFNGSSGGQTSSFHMFICYMICYVFLHVAKYKTLYINSYY